MSHAPSPMHTAPHGAQPPAPAVGSFVARERMMEIAGSEVEMVETPTTVWLLDREGGRFARVSPTAAVNGAISPYAVDWQSCSRIEHDPNTGAYALYLDDEGRRVLRFR